MSIFYVVMRFEIYSGLDNLISSDASLFANSDMSSVLRCRSEMNLPARITYTHERITMENNTKLMT